MNKIFFLLLALSVVSVGRAQQRNEENFRAVLKMSISEFRTFKDSLNVLDSIIRCRAMDTVMTIEIRHEEAARLLNLRREFIERRLSRPQRIEFSEFIRPSNDSLAPGRLAPGARKGVLSGTK